MAEEIEGLWREYHDRLLGFIASRVNDPATAEDIVQEVFLRMYTKMDTLKDSSKLRSWMYQIARNAIVDHYRSRRPMEALPETLSMPERDLADQARQEIGSCLVPIIQNLPEHYREAVMLSEIDGLPQREVAALQGVTLSGAKARVQRGRQIVKEMLTDCCQFEFDQQGTMVDYELRKSSCEGCDTSC
jgi:RNA polymerase sigma-70 factor (ECF subfamily)